MGVRQQRLQDAPCSSMGGGCQSNKYEDRQSRQLQRIKCTKWRDVMHWVVLSSALLLGTGVYPSEAFATSFVPRTGTFVPRGGSSASSTSPQRDTMECVLQSHSPKTDDSATTSNEQSKSKQPPNTATPSFVAAPAKNTDLDGSYDQDPTAPLRSSSTKENRNAIFHHNSDNDTESSSSSSGAKKFVGPILKDVAMPEARVGCAYVAETNLPTDVGHFRLRAYRLTSPSPNPQFTGTEPCVIYCTDKPPFGKNGFPVRIHDQCFTSEVFRSRRCDCKEQLKMSLEYIQKHGGAIIYLQQEGRGIGLANKIAAYEMQDGGMDTVEANIHLGFPEDCRQYGVVPGILADMGIDSIQLITNNPRKVNRLRGLGIDVVNTIPMVVKEANQYNRKYLETKVNRMNHTNFGDLLAASPSSTLSPADIAKANGSLSPEEKTVAENYITEGEEMAAVAIRTALMANDTQTGVAAAENGYCFGRESVEDAIAAIKRGELVVVVDDESRENEGDFIMAADLATPETMATMIRYTSGVICIGMEGARMDELKLPPMLTNNEDPKGTAFSVTVDATTKHGITTGISATDRAKTLNLLGGPESVITADDFVRPGHIFPLRAREGGVLTRDGHTEASVDLSRLAGRHPSGVLCEIVSEEHPTEMARLPELKRFCKRHGFVLTSIVDIAQYRRDTDQ